MNKVVGFKRSFFSILLLYFIIDISLSFFPIVFVGYLHTNNKDLNIGIVYLLLGIIDYISIFLSIKLFFIKKEINYKYNNLIILSIILMFISNIIKFIYVYFNHYNYIYFILIIGLYLINISLLLRNGYKLMKISDYHDRIGIRIFILIIGIILSILSLSFLI